MTTKRNFVLKETCAERNDSELIAFLRTYFSLFGSSLIWRKFFAKDEITCRGPKIEPTIPIHTQIHGLQQLPSL